MATVETELVEEISSELLLVKAENIQLLELIAAKDSVIQKQVKEIDSQKIRIRALRLINRTLFNENKELMEKLGERER